MGQKILGFGPDNIIIIPLKKTFLRGSFKGEENEPDYCHKLIRWFKTTSWEAMTERSASTYVILFNGLLAGFVTVSMVIIEHVPDEICRRISSRQVLNLGKLYISNKYRSKGIGSVAIEFVAGLARSVNELVGCSGIIVDANQNEKTIKFYAKNEFVFLNEIEENTKTVRMYFSTKT